MSETQSHGPLRALTIAGWVLVAVFTVGLGAELVPDNRRDNWGAIVLLVVSLVAVVAGLLMLRRRVSGVGLALVGVGALPGAFALVWSVLAPLLAIVVVALALVIAVKSSREKALGLS